MKIFYKLTVLAAAALTLASCNDYLDMTPTDSVSDKLVWSSLESAEYAVNDIYGFIFQMSQNQCVAGMTDALTDTFKYGSYNYNSLCFIPSEIAYGGVTLTNGYVDTYLGYWGTLYGLLRRTNEGIYNLHKFGKLSAADTDRLEGEMKLVRGFLYFELAKRYKSVIVYDENLDEIKKDINVSSEKEVWDMVENDLNYAAKVLPERENAKGRLNKGVAYAFLTRAMLYAERWQAVVDAAKELEKLNYSLEQNYADSYSKSIGAGNNEAIFQQFFDIPNGIYHDFDYYYTPGGDYTLNGQIAGGYGTPTQEIVEAYEKSDGTKVDWTPWHTEEGTTEEPPYAELEPRFQASILYNGATWKQRTIEPYVNGSDGWCQWHIDVSPKGRTTTGYYLRKGVNENHDVISVAHGDSPITLIRYAEVLLNKAEAAYHLNDNATANAAVKAVRQRVQLPYNDKSGDNLMAAIRQERKVELAFEGLLYWDLRRWGVADKQYPEGLTGYQQHGLKIERYGTGFKYTYVSVDDKDRNFPSKLYQFPIPESELHNNSQIQQYPAWN